jgi:hypothetical protein
VGAVINLFTRKVDEVQTAIRDFNEGNLPHEGTLPDTPTGEHAVLGKDANLPLIVKELAPMQLETLRREREKLQKRLDEIAQYENTLHALLSVLN